MKSALTIILLIQTGLLFGQKIKISEDNYGRNRPHWKGFRYCIRLGKYSSCSDVGKWTFWHENGQKNKEVIYYKNQQKIINAWLPNGQQTLVNGTGFYSTTEPFSYFVEDSCIYTYSDSVKNGFYKRFIKTKENRIFLYETGYYQNNLKEGTFLISDSIYNRRTIQFYVLGEETGDYSVTDLQGKNIESGQKINGKKTGRWTYFNQDGRINKICNYKNGVLFGTIIEYYDNGIPKLIGQYSHMEGIRQINVEDPVTGEKWIKEEWVDYLVARDGQWKYYDKSGELIEKKIYKNEEVLAE